MPAKPSVRIAAIGLNHFHIYGMTKAMLGGGAELVLFHAPEDELALPYQQEFPQAKRVGDPREIFEDGRIQMILSASVPAERHRVGIAAMRHGKDFFSDKPGFTAMAQLDEVRLVQRETGRIYSICYSERLEVPASVHAGELVAAGAIGRVLQTIGLGPHRLNAPRRKPWFFQPDLNGGALADIASHQMDQFLFFTGSTQASVVSSRIGNLGHPDYPEFEDFGEAIVTGNGGEGYMRVDWFTPDGLPTWGDGRFTILGTEGTIELRKYVDIAGRPAGNHLFLVDKKETRHIDCAGKPLPFGGLLIADIVNRTETAMAQAHCFLASQLALEAQAQAVRIPAKGR
ncbi:MAG: Gfo/Idh/MocA family oxidoreductase [Proteobacteria bacterium]|nr:Gfo/Idh/MocA family oxidoreductase [Pseudomonadota bacterium]